MSKETEYIQYIEDTAVIYKYDPYRYGGTASRGWESSYTDGDVATPDGLWLFGQGDSRHVTTRVGSTVEFSFRGTGVDLLGIAGGYAYDVLVDGASVGISNPTSGTLASIRALSNDLHTIKLVVGESNGSADALFVFDKAILTVATGYTGATVTSTRFDDIDSVITYAGSGWQRTNSPYLEASDAGIHQTQVNGDSATLEFDGISIRVVGNTNANHGQYAIMLDNDPPITLDAQTVQFIGLNNLFFASGLDPTRKHRIVVTNLGNTSMELDFFERRMVEGGTPIRTGISAVPSTDGNPGKRVNIAAIAGSVAGVVVLAVLIIVSVVFIKQRNKKKKAEEAEVRQLARDAGMRFSLPATAPATRPVVQPDTFNSPPAYTATTSHSGNPAQNPNFRWTAD